LWIVAAVHPERVVHRGPDMVGGWPRRLAQTLAARGPWLVSLCFAVYSAQWLAVIGFLPSIYAEAGFAGVAAGAATALAAGVNIVGNVGAGRLLQRAVAPHRLLYVGFAAMGFGALLAFAPIWHGTPAPVAAAFKYAAVLLFSMLGGLIPATLFTLAVRLAPGDQTVATTVGWMQQWSSVGQFVGPPVVAWLATAYGGWQWSWVVTGACAMAGLVLARQIQCLMRARLPPAAGTPQAPR
jgi:cyanate permease